MKMGQVDETQGPIRKSRRKACDLCFIKKIKCDRATPLCSHCRIYGAAACTYTPLTRTPNPKAIPRSRADVLESKLKELEARLKVFEGDNDQGQSQAAVSPANKEKVHTQVTETRPSASENLALTPESLPEFIGSDITDTRSESYGLPDLPDILPCVSQYFNTFNREVPLFHEPNFMRMLRDWYSTPATRQDPAVWGAINIVLALARRRTYIDISSPRGTLDVYVRNAQTVLNQLIIRDQDLFGVQVVLGLAYIFYCSSDPKPATILIATAVRLAHSLQLNTLRGTDFTDPDVVTQRQRIFWILYVLDRDVALRIGQPAMLHENDIDLELPEEMPVDGVGLFYSDSGTTVNFFRKRIQFAWIQGKTYEWLLSVRAERLPRSVKDEHAKRLERAMNQWNASLPQEFQPDMLRSITDPTTFRTFVVMHFTRLQVLARVRNAYAHDTSWIATLRSLSQAVNDGEEPVVPRGTLPDNFDVLVQRSRENMKLFALLPRDDLYIVWQLCCSFFSGMIFLNVNCLANPHHPLVDEDMKLVEFALQVILRLEDETGNTDLASMRKILAELDSKTRSVIEWARRHRLPADVFNVSAFDVSPMDTVPVQGPDSADPAFTSCNAALDAELFSSWLETQYFDVGASYTEAMSTAGQEKPNFEHVVSVLLKQSWF